MFDYVCIKVICPVCGREMSEFQTKDTECFMDYLLPGKSYANPKLRHIGVYTYCQHKWATIKRGMKENPYDTCVSHLWMDVTIPINKNGVISRDVRKYKTTWYEHPWDMNEMATAKYPTIETESSLEVLTKNKETEELKLKGPYKPMISLDYERYDAVCKAEADYFTRIVEECKRKTDEVIEECKERNITPTCDNCIHNKDAKCHLLPNISGVDMDFSNPLMEKGFCGEWVEKDVKTEW